MNRRCIARVAPGARFPQGLAAALTALCIAAPAASGAPAEAAETTVAQRLGAPGGGGSVAPSVPEITDVICRRECAGLRSPTPGGLIEVTGSELDDARAVSFPGPGGRVLSSVTRSSATRLFAPVPEDADDGQIRVRGPHGSVSDLSEASLDIRPRSELGSAGELTLREASVTPRRTFLFGTSPPILSFVIASDQSANDLRIDVVDTEGAVVRSFFRDDVPPNATQSIRWDGRATDKSPVGDGRYSFRIAGQAGAGAERTSDVGRGALTVSVYGYIFPVRGTHDFGSAGSRFGAGRSGHSHQGHDVFAACGTPMVAARGGRVRYSGYQSSAGYYMVIDGRGSGRDLAYMHLMRPPRFATGETVRTGQRIGEVGETGNAVGCHLHFEIWTAPGWYVGGAPIDPLPSLRRWDSYS